VLRPAVSHLGGEKTSVSRQNSTVETVSQTDGNTGSFQAKSEFLNLYPIKNNKLAHSTPSQPKPTVKNGANNTQKPVEMFSGESKPKASEYTDINYADRIMNWDEF